MQIFLFGALGISLLALIFALQNNVPVTVSFFGWMAQGSLALVLFFAFAAGALVSSLASMPALVRARLAASQQRKQSTSLEASLAETRRRLEAAETRLRSAGRPLQPESGSNPPASA